MEIDRSKLTPMMKQYFDTKEKYPDCILFFRLGDFYEMFFEDAIVASKVLEIALTGKACGLEERAPMCGVPFHAANAYISVSYTHLQTITKAEILEAINNPLGVETLTGIKYRCRAMMGRCQGGYCETRIAGLLEEVKHKNREDVLYSREGSNMFVGKVRD